jgi:hypothetical protein
MQTFIWHRIADGRRNRVRWMLWDKFSSKNLGICHYLNGSKRWCCSAAAPVEGGVILTDYYAGTAAAARKALERDWDKRSIGLFKDDEIEFRIAGA